MGFLTDLLFPPRCALCGRPGGERSAPCRSCQADAALWLTGPDAVRRGAAFSLCVCAGAYQGVLRDSVRRFKFLGHPEYAQVYGPILAETVRRTLAGRYDTIAWMPVSAGTLATPGRSCGRSGTPPRSRPSAPPGRGGATWRASTPFWTKRRSGAAGSC